MARVYIAGLNGTWTQLIANTGSLFDNTGWRQARIDLSAYAGQSDLKLRFEFSTAGSIDLGNIETGGTELRALNGDSLRDADSFNIDGTTFEFDLGYTVVLPAGSQIFDGDLVTVTTPDNVSHVFEFDNNGSLNDPSHIRVGFTETDSPNAIATAFREAVTVAAFGITAIQNGQRVNLVDKTGAFSTPAVTETLSDDSTLANAQNLDLQPFTVDSDQNFANSTSIPHLALNGTGDGTYDYYKVSIAQNQQAIFKLMNPTFTGRLTLFDALGNQLAAGTNALTYTPKSSDSIFSDTGTYFLRVASGFGNAVLPAGATYTLNVSIENHRYANTGSHDVTNVFVTRATPGINGPGILVEGGDGVTPGRVEMLIDAGMTDDQVADVMRRAIANQLLANPVPLETIKAYNEVIQVYGHTVFDAGRLGLTTSLPGSTPTSLFPTGTYLNPLRPFNDPKRGQNNDHEGMYIDDVVIGFAERGEVATGSPTEAALGAPFGPRQPDRRDRHSDRELPIGNSPGHGIHPRLEPRGRPVHRGSAGHQRPSHQWFDDQGSRWRTTFRRREVPAQRWHQYRGLRV